MLTLLGVGDGGGLRCEDNGEEGIWVKEETEESLACPVEDVVDDPDRTRGLGGWAIVGKDGKEGWLVFPFGVTLLL